MSGRERAKVVVSVAVPETLSVETLRGLEVLCGQLRALVNEATCNPPPPDDGSWQEWEHRYDIEVALSTPADTYAAARLKNARDDIDRLNERIDELRFALAESLREVDV